MPKTVTPPLAANLCSGMFNDVLQHISDSVIIFDKQGRVIYANKIAEKITGYSTGEMLSGSVNSEQLWGREVSLARYKKIWSNILKSKKPYQVNISAKKKNGESYTISTTIVPVLSETGENLFLAIAEDITREREVDHAKTEFVYLASHQLRTPLSTINWYIEMLLSGDAGALNPEQKKYIDEVYQSNQNMVELVNDLLNVSRLDLGTIAIEPELLQISSLIDQMIATLAPQIKKKKTRIVTKYDPAVPLINTDGKLMRMILQNLLTNAVKYTPENGKVEISLKISKPNFIIMVKDNGYGIPKAVQSKIFTKLFRADNVRERETDGTGLGLYVVKSVVEQLKGKIWFKSAENKGTIFYVALPLAGVKKREGIENVYYA